MSSVFHIQDGQSRFDVETTLRVQHLTGVILHSYLSFYKKSIAIIPYNLLGLVRIRV